MKNFRSSLLCVKTILTIVVSIGFVILTFCYPDDFSETMKNVVTIVITFYFSHQVNKNNSGGEN